MTKSLKVLSPNRTWRIGDSRDLDELQLRSLEEPDTYDSYDQTYILDGLKWKIAGRMANRDGSTQYTLIAVEGASS